MIILASTYKGKSTKLGGGGRFQKLKDSIMKSGKSADSAEAIAASIGRKKLGSAKMSKLATQAKKRKGAK